MSRSLTTVRYGMVPAFAAGAVGLIGVVGALLTSVTATAEPPPRPPNCTAADLAGIASGVAAATSTYLWTHPDVNDFYTNLHGRPQEEVPDATRTFFDANPQAHTDLLGIRQPMTDFRDRCGIKPPDQPLGQR
ncbi:hemophore-related protein [Mycolicibacterium lutetiense]|uniref:Hemophore-related protein n=2 Tax=Mycolicibacterium lutetiense TaxID=1641992 RepID=A0ABS4ZYU5_9MYCO|nr:heme-binding protein [Mycolicibacterium lutetiense]MBP2454693.1 hemophore-related protein [Mycolicibacterium lutetiense]